MGDVKIDFFANEKLIADKCFGICDDKDTDIKTPAYVDINVENKSKWNAVVENKANASVCFIAVDNSIDILRPDGTMENRCDAMLYNNNYIVFVELKDQLRDWIQHAVNDQLVATINAFRNSHDINAFRHKVAYVCNRKHPRFAVSHKKLMQTFYNKHDVRLVISRNIVIK